MTKSSKFCIRKNKKLSIDYLYLSEWVREKLVQKRRGRWLNVRISYQRIYSALRIHCDIINQQRLSLPMLVLTKTSRCSSVDNKRNWTPPTRFRRQSQSARLQNKQKRPEKRWKKKAEKLDYLKIFSLMSVTVQSWFLHEYYRLAPRNLSKTLQ
jgi:hypothetical protein